MTEAAPTAEAPSTGEKAPNICGILVFQPDANQIYCRLCLSSFNFHYKQLFSPFNPTQTIVDIIEDFADISIFKDDGHSQLICIGCFNRLADARNFKFQIESSDSKLQNRVNIRETPSQPSKPVSNDKAQETVKQTSTEKSPVPESAEVLRNDDNNSDLGEPNDLCETVSNHSDRENREQPLSVAQVIKKEILDDIDIEETRVECCPDVIKIEELKQIETKAVQPPKRSHKKKVGVTVKPETVKKKRIKKLYHLKCPHCDKVYTRHNELKAHISRHTGVFACYCSYCNKGYATKSALKNHEAFHTGEIKFQCETCGKNFKYGK